jgi:hypothetical protein
VTLWARTNEQTAPPISNGGDLIEANEVLQKAQLAASAARTAEPQLIAEMERAQARRARLEDEIRGHARDALGELADEISARIADHERAIGVEVARLAALRRPMARLAGQDAMTGRKAVAAINTLVGERWIDEAAARSFEGAWQALSDRLLGDASAQLQNA